MDEETRLIRVNKRELMSSHGIQQWSPNGRIKLHRFIYKNLGSFRISYEDLSYRNNLAQWLHNNFGDGYYQIMLWRKGYFKNKLWQRSYVIACFDLKNFSHEGKFEFENRGIKRFSWFEPKKEKQMDNFVDEFAEGN